MVLCIMVSYFPTAFGYILWKLRSTWVGVCFEKSIDFHFVDKTSRKRRKKEKVMVLCIMVSYSPTAFGYILWKVRSTMDW